MLAHSVAHAAARHGVRMASRGQILNFSTVPLVFVGGWSGIHGSDKALPLAFRRLARGFEAEADRIAAQAMARAGYNPMGFLRYIERLQVDENPISSPRPMREVRIARLAQAIAELPGIPSSFSGEFERIRAMVKELALEAAATAAPR